MIRKTRDFENRSASKNELRRDWASEWKGVHSDTSLLDEQAFQGNIEVFKSEGAKFLCQNKGFEASEVRHGHKHTHMKAIFGIGPDKSPTTVGLKKQPRSSLLHAIRHVKNNKGSSKKPKRMVLGSVGASSGHVLHSDEEEDEEEEEEDQGFQLATRPPKVDRRAMRTKEDKANAHKAERDTREVQQEAAKLEGGYFME